MIHRVLFVFGTICSSLAHSQTLTKYVNPFVGTDGHGHTFPGATLPFGMVQLSPDTRIDGSWDGCSGYHYSDSFIYGFSHTHLSGTGVSDYGDILLMPMSGKPKFDPEVYKSPFVHSSESAAPGYYKVQLEKDNINVSLSATERTGMHEYRFPRAGIYSVVLDLQHRDKLTDYEIKIVGKNKVMGFRRSAAWAQDEVVYFTIEFSQPFIKKYWSHNRSKAGFAFINKGKNSLKVKVGISFCNTDGAAENLRTENPGWDIDSLRYRATEIWNTELSRIVAESKDSQEMVKFYTALYHCMIHPNIANDVNGKYRGMDNQIHTARDYNHYTVFSLWDTYRALHPLLTIIDEERTLDFIKTFLAMYREGGRLPVWELAGNETNCMIGYHAASVITDAWMKGIKEFDSTVALQAMLDISNEDAFGKKDYRKMQYISSEFEPESVSKTLEYAYDDWCIGVFARSTGNESVAQEFGQRSQNWYYLQDPESGYMRPRFNGSWLEPFDPREVNNHFTEANSWQYSFSVPHDIRNLMRTHGGHLKLGNRLDQFFADTSGTTGRNQADITGLIGQYAHGNEPSHHIAYLYNYIYMPERTQNLIHKICTEFYTTKADGLIGNEDCGQMSAWYVMSALGFYQVAPSFPWYTIGTPSLDNAEIKLKNGNTFRIETHNRLENTWFNTAKLNGEPVRFFSHNDILSGAVLHFNMSEAPGPESLEYLLPPIDQGIIKKSPPPLIIAPRSFKDFAMVSIEGLVKTGRIYYYIDEDSLKTQYYKGPFKITGSSTIHAFQVNDYGIETVKSPIAVAKLHKMKNDWVISVVGNPNPQYTAGGNNALIDGIRGTKNWRAGDWQGYQGQDIEILVDLGSMQLVSEVSSGFLQDMGSWIAMPIKMEISLSTEGSSFIQVGSVNNHVKPEDMKVQIQDLTCKIQNPRKCRYVKIKVYGLGKLPKWHPGYGMGGESFIFVDDVDIR